MTVSVYFSVQDSLSACPVWWQNFINSLPQDKLDRQRIYLNHALREYNASKTDKGRLDFETEEDATRFILTWL